MPDGEQPTDILLLLGSLTGFDGAMRTLISANLDGVDRIITKAAVGVFHVTGSAEFSRDFLAGSTELVAENSHLHTVEFGKTLSVDSPNGSTSNENYMEFRYGMLEGECCKSPGDEKTTSRVVRIKPQSIFNARVL